MPQLSTPSTPIETRQAAKTNVTCSLFLPPPHPGSGRPGALSEQLAVKVEQPTGAVDLSGIQPWVHVRPFLEAILGQSPPCNFHHSAGCRVLPSLFLRPFSRASLFHLLSSSTTVEPPRAFRGDCPGFQVHCIGGLASRFSLLNLNLNLIFKLDASVSGAAQGTGAAEVRLEFQSTALVPSFASGNVRTVRTV